MANKLTDEEHDAVNEMVHSGWKMADARREVIANRDPSEQQAEDKPRVRPPSVAAAYLLEKVRKMEKEEAGIIEAARIKHRARIAGLVAKAPAEVQKHYFALAGAGKDSDHE